MLRTSLIALALLAVSSGVMAGHDDRIYGRVVSVEPHFTISFGGGRHHDGFRVLYEFGGRHYWTHSHHHPGHQIWVPRPHGAVVYRPYRHEWQEGHRKHWHDHDRYRHDWRHDKDWGDRDHDDHRDHR